MSFFLSEDGTRIVDKYPPAAISLSSAVYNSETDPWKGIPRDVDLLTWMRIVPWMRRGGSSREYRLFYEDAIRKPASANKPWTLSVALYGFIESMSLSLTGDWNLSEEHASKAAQWIRLCPGPLPKIFAEQGDALSAVEQHIIGTLRGGGLPVEFQDAMTAARKKRLYIARRVFDRVGPGCAPSLPVVGPAAQMVNKWRVTSTAKMGYRRDDLQLQSCNAAKLAPGDFVQVHAKFVVVAKDSKPGEPPKVFVNLDLISVMRLVTARHVPTVMPSEGQAMTEEKAIGKTIVPEFEENIDEGPDML